MARKFSVLNHKGGVGKSTTCANLAVALASLGKRVLVILYGDSPKGSIEKRAIKQAKKNGFDWYLGDIDLSRIGHTP